MMLMNDGCYMYFATLLQLKSFLSLNEFDKIDYVSC